MYFSVHGSDIIFNQCGKVHDGANTEFQATLYKANLSVCDLLTTTKVTFQLKYPTAATENLCEQLLSPCNSTANAKGCSCVSDRPDAYIFEYSFTFNKSKHEGSTLDLIPDCGSTNPNGLIRVPCELIIEGINFLSLSLSLWNSLPGALTESSSVGL